MKIVTLSSKQQITIPKELLLALGGKLLEKFILEAENGVLILKPITGSLVDELAGSLRRYVPREKLGVPFKIARKETKKIVAARLAKK